MNLKNLVCGIFALTAAMLLALLAAAWVADRQPPGKLDTVHFLAMTNGTVGLRVSAYRSYATNDAATLQQWFANGTNAVLLRVTNNQECAIWVSPFASIAFENSPSRAFETILLGSPIYPGTRLAAGQATNLQVMLLPATDRLRIQLSLIYDEKPDSFITEISYLLRNLHANFTGTPIVTQEHPIKTDWIKP